jgi:predicted transposase YdaD
VAQSGLDDARKFLLLHIIETYFVLAGAQRDEFDRALLQERYREVRKMQMTWVEKIEKKGRKEGREEGMLEGRREALLRLLTTKFGPLPEEMISRVRAVQSLPELDSYLDRVLVAASLEDMGLRG